MEIHIFNRQRDLSLKKARTQAAVQAIIAHEGQACDEVSIHFVNTNTIAALHEQFFDDPSPTDCISFPMDEEDHMPGYRVLGEIIVCPQAAIGYCAKHGGDPYRETTLYVIHGLLHLMGYDDLDPAQRKVMRQAEKRHLKHLQELKLLLY